MARTLRIEFSGALYHVTARTLGFSGKDSELLFRDDADRSRFLKGLAVKTEQFRVRLYLFCLMRNHLHLVLETPDPNLGKFMHDLTTAYTVYFNLRHRRHGHLFEGRYKARLVESDAYLLKLSRYVHLNPVQTSAMKDSAIEDKVKLLREYKWSSYRSYIGEARPLDFVDYALLAQVGDPVSARPVFYRQYVESGLAKNDDEFQDIFKKSRLAIGGDGFCDWARETHSKLTGGRNQKEDVSLRRQLMAIDPETVLAALADALKIDVREFRKRKRNSLLRGAAGFLLCRYSGLTQREAAERLGVASGSSLSQQMRKLADPSKIDDQIRQGLEKARRCLD